MTDMPNTVEVNPNKQYILAGDISGSMSSKDPKCQGQQRYYYMLEKFKSFIKTAEDYDPDGVTVMLFGENIKTFRNTTLDNIDSRLSNVTFDGWTMTDRVVEECWRLHKEEKSQLAKEGKVHPGTVVFIFTDGEPTNRKALARVITEIANQVDREDEFSIGFLTVGTIDANLRDFLEYIDDGLKAKYDIVGVRELEQTSFLRAVHNAINE